MTVKRACCGCVPPERHPGCHESCPRYRKEREAAERRYRDRLREHIVGNVMHDGMKRVSSGGGGMNVKMYKGGKQR